jgi:peptidoglycan biosynthesis protein MviN/MurJ (putative lipid II flippase)
MAIVVAMVPTRGGGLCQDTGSAPVTGFEQSPQAIADAVLNNIWALIGTTAVVVLVKLGLWLRNRNRGYGNVQTHRRPWSVLAVLTLIVCAGALIGEFIYFLTQPDGFIDDAHGIAALTMVIGLIFVMIFNALFVEHEGARLGRLKYRAWYGILAGTLGVFVAVTAVAAWPGKDSILILVLELVVFAGFVAYWILQSIELWGKDAEIQPAHPADEPEPAVPVDF